MKTSLLLIFLSASLFAAVPIAKVNDQVLYDEEWLEGDKKDAEAVENAVTYHLIVEEAKKLNLDKNPAVQKEIRKLLYREYLNTKLKDKAAELAPSDLELRAATEQNPLYKVKHLVLFSRNKREQKAAKKSMERISQRLKRGDSFKSIVLKFSQDGSARTGGNLDFRGPHNFPEAFYGVVSKLKANEVSQPLTYKGAIHYFQWTEKKPFDKLPQNYLNYLSAKIEKSKQSDLMKQLMVDLKKGAKVEILQTAKVQ